MNLAIYVRIDVSKDKLSGVMKLNFLRHYKRTARGEKILKKPLQPGNIWLFTFKRILRVVGASPQVQALGYPAHQIVLKRIGSRPGMPQSV